MKDNIGFVLGLVASVITILQAMYLGIPTVWESPTFNYLHALLVSFFVAIAVCYAALHIGYVRRGRKSEWLTNQFGTHQQYPQNLTGGVFVLALLSWGAPFLIFTTAGFGEVGYSKDVPGGVVMGMLFALPLGVLAVMGCATALHRMFNPD
jgi:hypothetical protein